MLKMLKMDLYRILKSKMTIVMILLTVVISALVTYSISYSVKQMQTNETVKQFVQEREVGAEENDVSAGIEIQSQSEWAEEDAKISAGMLFTTFLPSGILVILLSVFAAKFVNDENKNGFIKNISGFVKGRHTIALSKMLAIMIFTVFLFVLLFVSLMIMSLIFLGYLNFDGFADDLPIIALQLLAHFGIVALIGTCSVLFRNGGFAMTIGITFASGMPNIFGGMINLLLSNKFNLTNFDINDYFISTYVLGLKPDSPASMNHWAIGVSLGYIVISAMLAMIIMKKRDVR